MVEKLTQRMEYQHEGRLLKSSMTGSYATQLTDLTTEEKVASAGLANSIQTRKIYLSHTMSAGVGRADRDLTERVELQAGDEGKEIPLRACTTRSGNGRDTAPQWQPDRQDDTKESDLSDLPE
jgi:hypothetical protein